MRHVGNAEGSVALNRSVAHIDGIVAEHDVDEPPGWTLPAVDLVLTHGIHELAPLALIELGEPPAVAAGLARAIDRPEHRSVETRKGRPHVEDPRLEQRFLRRDRELLIHEVGNPRLPGTGNERLSQRFEGLDLLRGQCPEWEALRARLARREQNLDAAHRKGERAHYYAFDEGAPFDVLHGFL